MAKGKTDARTPIGLKCSKCGKMTRRHTQKNTKNTSFYMVNTDNFFSQCLRYFVCNRILINYRFPTLSSCGITK